MRRNGWEHRRVFQAYPPRRVDWLRWLPLLAGAVAGGITMFVLLTLALLTLGGQP